MNLLIFVLFFVSGACGLVYEVVWSRMMQQIFGRSSLAVGVVLAAFMSGLAIGSYLLGKYSDRSRNPLRLYAFYEMGIGVSALGATLLLGAVTPIYISAHQRFGDSSALLACCQFVITFTPLILPTILMGATLPILSRIVLRQLHRVERDLGRLYAINTIGAVAGSLATGFWLIKQLGLHGTVYAAVAGNLAVGITALLASSRLKLDDAAADGKDGDASIQAPGAAAARRSPKMQRIILCTFALSGFTSFAYEIFWTRSLVFLVGNTTYAFSLMLTAFLVGIALGGYCIRFVSRKVASPLLLFAAIEVSIGGISAASLPLLFAIVKSGSINDFLARMSGQLGFLALSNFAVALILMLIPATLIGATFPLISRIFLDDLKSAGATVGKVYAVNTLGNVFGALLPGLVILPLLGVQKGILLLAAVNVCLGVVSAFCHCRRGVTGIAAAAALLAVGSIFLVQMPLFFQFPSAFQKSNDGVLFYDEGDLVTTKVWASVDPDYKIISVDSVGIGGTSDSDYKQQVLAHLPKLLLKSYHTELSIGLGSGILAGESARHSALKRIDCVELARGVVAGSRYFSRENFDILHDPRARIVIDDVADFLQTTDEKYDIISADEKTAGKYASNSMSYSSDYYQMLRRHLAPGGLVIQWMPTDLPPSQYSLALRTFLASFPHVTLWYFPPIGRFTMPNSFMVGSCEEIAIDPGWINQQMTQDPQSFRGIAKYGLTSAESILAHFIANEKTLRGGVPSGPINSFEHPYFEFYSPRDYAVPAEKRDLVNHEMLMSFRQKDGDSLLRTGGRPGWNLERQEQAYRAEGALMAGRGLQLLGGPAQAVLHQYEQALAIAPWDLSLGNEIVHFLNTQAMEHSAQGDTAGSRELFRRAAEIFPTGPEVHYDYGLMLLFLREPEAGMKELRQALSLDPDLVPALRQLGGVYASRGQFEPAMQLWERALSIAPYDFKTLTYKGRALTELGFGAEGMALLKRAYAIAPENSEVLNALNYSNSTKYR